MPAYRWVVPLAVFVVTAAVYLPVLDNGFVNWDDDRNLTENWSYRGLGTDQLRWMFTTFHMGHYQPLAWVSYGLDFTIWGMRPMGYHLTSLLIHAATAVVFFSLAVRLFRRAAAIDDDRALILAAGAAALIFALHPLRVESVAWATERRDLLSGLFFFLSILFYIRAAEPPAGPIRLVPAFVCFCCAVLSKASALTLPFVLIVLDAYPLGRGRRLAEKVPFLAVSVLIGIVALMGQKHNEGLASLTDSGVPERIAIAFYGLAYYVVRTAAPIGLSPVHLHPETTGLLSFPYVVSTVVVLVLSAIVLLRGRGGRPALLAIWIVYGLVLAPVIGLAQVWRQIVSDRYAYVSCAGFALLLPALWLRRTRVRHVALAMTVIVIVLLGVTTRREVGVWRDSETLWRHAIDVDPRNYIAHNNLAVALRAKGRLDEGARHLEEALRIRPTHAEAHHNLANALFEEKRFEEAIGHYRSAIEAQPGRAAYYMNLGNALHQLGRHDAAIGALRSSVALDPDEPLAHWNLAIALRAAGHQDEADAEERRAIRLSPLTPDQRVIRGEKRLASGDIEGAVRELEEALRQQPGLAAAHYNLGVCLMRLGRYEEAVDANRAALSAREDYSNARINLGAALTSLGRFDESVAVLERAVSEKPRSLPAVANLARSLASVGRFDDAIRWGEEAVRLARAQGDTSLETRLSADVRRYAEGRL